MLDSYYPRRTRGVKDRSSGRESMKHLTDITLLAAALLLLDGPGARAEDAVAGALDPQAARAPQEKHSPSRTIIYPILASAPLFGASVHLPPIELPGGGVEVPSGSTTSSFDGAVLAGFRIDRDRWFFEVEGLWAGLSAERELPRVRVSSDVVYGRSMFGWRVYKDVLVTGGVRHMALDIGAQVDEFPEVSRKPGIWDPLLGVAWRRAISPSWTVTAGFQGGGFGVGADVDLGGALAADWRFANRFGLTLGYSVLHFKVSDTVARQTFETRQTLHGPVLGFGIYFGQR
jgi:hypothetical protein